MPETPIEETIRAALQTYAASEPFAIPPRQAVARAKRRLAGTAVAAILAGAALFSGIVVGASAIRDATETAPGDETSFVPTIPTATCCLPAHEALVFGSVDRSIRYVDVPVNDIDARQSIMIGATPLAATPDGSAVLVDTQGGLIGVYPGGHAFVTVSQIPSGLDGGAISPDGNTVVFAAEGGLFQDSTVDGTPTRILLHSGPGFSLSQPVWSPDGTRIAYVRTRASGSVLELLDMATGRSTALLDDAVFGTWSPDGSVLAVLRPAAGGAGATVLITDLGGATRKVSTTRAIGHPAWSPDGTRIAFATSDTEVTIASVDGSSEKRFAFPAIAAGSPVLLWVPGSTDG